MRSKEVAIKNLKQYIAVDLIFKRNSPQSDFEKFCINHCIDIETVLNYISELEKENELYKLKTGEPPLYESEIVSKQAIKDKIEELEEKVQGLSDEEGYWGGQGLLAQIEVLNELLEGE